MMSSEDLPCPPTRVFMDGVDLAPYVSAVSVGSYRVLPPGSRAGMPEGPHDRRTARIAGKDYHWVQGEDRRLHLEPGESPWI